MFALLALITFILAIFNVALGSVNLVILGFIFLSAHFLLGPIWGFGGVTLPARRRD